MPSPETPPPPASERACFGITSFFPGQVNVEPRPPDSKQDAAGEVGADSFPASPRGGQRIPCAAVFLKFPALPEASCGNPEPSLPLPSPGHHVRPPRQALRQAAGSPDAGASCAPRPWGLAADRLSRSGFSLDVLPSRRRSREGSSSVVWKACVRPAASCGLERPLTAISVPVRR